MNKIDSFDALMKQVAACRLCMGAPIAPPKQLINIVAEFPLGPRYGKCPTHWTDWASRLDARLAIIGQDWGPWTHVGALRKQYAAFAQTRPEAAAWQAVIDYDADNDPSTRKLIMYLEQSARNARLTLSPGVMNRIYVSNQVLCTRQGANFAGEDNFDKASSGRNCHQRNFLWQQLDIVRPAVVVTLGELPLRGLGLMAGQSLTKQITQVQKTKPGYLTVKRNGWTLAVVPVFHPAARAVNRDEAQQIGDYSFIWQALADRMGQTGQDLVQTCF